MKDLPSVEVSSRQELRDWLAANAASSAGIWLVTWRKGAGPHVPYGDVVEEALCVGWIDSLPRRLDDTRTQLLLTPRSPRSNWSAANKARVERLTAAGLMTAAGLAVVEAARASGTWSALDDVEALVEPAELAAALDAVPAARRSWDGFPPSARRGILEWLLSARTAPTRQKRIGQIVSEAAAGRRANQWRPAPGRPEDSAPEDSAPGDSAGQA